VYALAAGLVAAQLADAGLQLSVTREMAQAGAASGAVARLGLRLKLRLALAAASLLALIALTRPPLTQLATWAAGASVIVGSFVDYAGFAFRGLHRIIDDARLTLISRAVTAAIGMIALWNGAGLTAFALTQLGAAALVAVAASTWLRFQLPPGDAHETGPDRSRLFTRAWPLGAAILLSIGYSRTPTFLLDVTSGPTAVGLFGVAQRLIEPLSVVPAAVLAAVFPAIVRDNHLDPRRALALRRRTVLGLTAVGAAIAMVGGALGPSLVRALYDGQYAGAERPLQILALAAMLTFANYALTHFLVSFDRQSRLMQINAVVLIANVVLCGTLASRFGPTGAALAMLLSEGLLCVACLVALRHTSTVTAASPASNPIGPAL
jgi:O-antigen/teichoic acid export membrane protein